MAWKTSKYGVIYLDIRIELPFFGTVLKRQIAKGGEMYVW